MLSRNDLRRTDMSLLVLFEAMMHERNVSRVGEKFFIGQPAVSSALARLRVMFNDQLFIRNGRYMEPTARAADLHELLTPMLDTIASTLDQVADFDPADSNSTFHIGLSDDVEYGLLPMFLRHLRAEAPGVKLVVHRTNCSHMSSLLVSGEISVGISHTSELPATSKRKFLRLIRFMALRADLGNEALSLDEFCRRPHATISSMGSLIADVDRVLKQISRTRLAVLDVPHFSALAVLLADSDLLAVVPDYVANAMATCAGIRAEPLPFEISALELSMVWRAVADNDPAERWLRSRFSEYLSDSSRRLLSIVAA
ncbi:LysR substrate-binding domain-containing protein [Pseudomonas sp. 14P_8.1_Bac3]|uniref:LysR substrate-binding domain-containing protein n=1 Tax=Pseudomonas sp. 14P_8.1_Bac3 TaxID=2971621 RepID=UPI0021CA1908|nr:LysR substrate-binding domain-containing protein [Pseudomonas sp. 14P_8.1_Bac3]MCU1758791.1 LysR substrate-binding domain-containing protein [Pseudomonas sp. 14P_8.1_Bac3]